MHFKDIPKFPTIHYRVNIAWAQLLSTLDRYKTEHKLNLIPDFQRGHVWTKDQKIAYIEFMLKGPESSKNIYFNHPGWMSSFKGDFVLVDGLQRITAAIDFLTDQIPANSFQNLKAEFHQTLNSSSKSQNC